METTNSPPDFFYVFANTSNIMCWHNLNFTKSIASTAIAASQDERFLNAYLQGTASYVPFVPNQATSTSFRSVFSSNVTAEYRAEYDAERIRIARFPLAPSRFSCVFAFGSKTDCQKANEQYHWPLHEVRRFRLLNHPLTRVWKANMEAVSLMRYGYRAGSWSEEEVTQIWNHYWSGGGAFSIEVPAMVNNSPGRKTVQCGAIWEYLIEGHLELIDPL